MPRLSEQLILDSCTHCGRAKPVLIKASNFIETEDHKKENGRFWGIYRCTTCGGIITAGGNKISGDPKNTLITDVYPDILTISDEIPEKARELLRQAQNSLHAPAAAIMVCASAVDAMLKDKEYTDGSLYARIDQAAKDHLITEAMAEWAHQIRLDANVQRHADKDATLPIDKDAKLTFDFAIAFAEYLFVLPSKVASGITDATPS